jgi:REP element-mobilizing transposase RayT
MEIPRAKTGVRVDFPYNPQRHCLVASATRGGHAMETPSQGRDHAPPTTHRPGIPQHIVQRGNDRHPCFFNAIDYIRYLQDLREIASREHCSVHAYMLMTNHVHLLVTPMAAGQIGKMMQALGRRYVRYVNDRYHRTGTSWEGR